MTVASLELDLEVFSGPFALLLTLVLREEIDLLEVQLAEVVIAYLDFLEARGELDLEVATEFLVLIAALLELKSRLVLPRGAAAAPHPEAARGAPRQRRRRRRRIRLGPARRRDRVAAAHAAAAGPAPPRRAARHGRR